MPPKSRKKLKRRAKEEILVTSRLMTISLVVDDYIYKNKPISLLDAMKYDEEVTSLKIKCDKNLRSLQVVEKLKIFMKSIIKEQSTAQLQDNTSSFVTESINNNPLIALNDISENVENNITNNFQANNTTESFSNRENQNSQLNNILQDIPVNSVTSVKNTEIKLVEPNDIITSKNTIVKINNKSEENIICNSKNIDFDRKYCLDNPTNEKEQKESDLATLTASNLRKQLDQENTSLIQENPQQDEIEKTITKKNKTRMKNKITTKNKIPTKTNKNTDETNKELENKCSGVNKPKKKPKKMQVNLSWVENMKYVREVSPDEHTEIQIEDNFWSNLSLPGIWNLNNFD